MYNAYSIYSVYSVYSIYSILFYNLTQQAWYVKQIKNGRPHKRQNVKLQKLQKCKKTAAPSSDAANGMEK